MRSLLTILCLLVQGLRAQEIDFTKAFTESQKQRIYTADFYKDAIATGDLSNHQINLALKYQKDILFQSLREKGIAPSLTDEQKYFQKSITDLHKRSIPDELKDFCLKRGINNVDQWNQALIARMAEAASDDFIDYGFLPEQLIPFNVLTEQESLDVRKNIWNNMVRRFIELSETQEAFESYCVQQDQKSKKNENLLKKINDLDQAIDRSRMIHNQNQMLQQLGEQNEQIKSINTQLISR